MAFDLQKFSRTEYEPRTAEVEIQAQVLKDLFAKGDKPVFIVQGLTNDQVARTHEARDLARNREALIIAAETGEASDRAAAIKELMGVDDQATPAKAAFYLETVRQGLVEPKIPWHDSLKLAKVAPMDILNLANKILMLTGEGYCEKKTRRSTAKATSS